MKLECHITVDTVFAEKAEKVAKELHWKTSEIARDPLLGNKNFFYLTTHDTDFPRMWERMGTACANLANINVPVLRQKIELILYDERF